MSEFASGFGRHEAPKPSGSVARHGGVELTAKVNAPVRAFRSRSQWESWLAKHHATSDGVWLRIAKKGSDIDSVSYAEALEAALCYGWIDGRKAASDDDTWLQRFTPRSPRSSWSRINRGAAEQLIAAGRMKPAGLRQVERARADGRWEAAYEPQSSASVPDDLRRRFDEEPDADAFFSTLDSRNRYSILHRIQDAKRPETRARRIERFVAMLKDRTTLYP